MENRQAERIHAVAKGRVQGVGFRYFCQRTADKMSLSGWVKNLSNGDVELEVEGDSNTLKSFLTQIKEGNSWARVNELKTYPVNPTNKNTRFEIKF